MWFSIRTVLLRILSIVCVYIVGISCKEHNRKKIFTALKQAQTGIDFVNEIDPFQKTNIFDYLYYYNGGGVAIGDLNNDGLQDIYFTSNQGANKLFLNKGNLRFEDITTKAGVAGKGNWKTGVTLADVNNDGFLDIYVSEVGGYQTFKGHNELFINNGNLTFTEKAAQYGLAIEGFNTQASFFDYDHDGDLDVFLVNHSVHSNATLQDSMSRYVSDAKAGDKLFRNDTKNGLGKFTEVTKEAGIFSSTIGYGLNVTIADLNNDTWDDIYVSNDFHEEDYYYLNQRNGTFKELNKSAFAHLSRFSMGSDIADVNNDGWLDVFTVDMLPEDEKVLKESLSDDPNDLYQYKQREWKYHNQFSKNCLQLNVNGGDGFSDIGLYAGVAATDWSWGPLIADFNNDGMKDIFVSNGILKRPNNLDFLKYASGVIKTTADGNLRDNDREKLEKMPSGAVSNYIFEGTQSLKFINRSEEWGLEEPSLSNGAAYADLDNDGDLDIVVNNMNAQAVLYENTTNQIGTQPKYYLTIQLKGNASNPFAYGTKVTLLQNNRQQHTYVTATRGFQSASSTVLHFGLGSDSTIQAVKITWPDGKKTTIKYPKPNHHLVASYTPYDATKDVGEDANNQLFAPIQSANAYVHQEDAFNDFNVQVLMPHKVSTQGPKIAVADVNDDGLDDFYVGGAKGQAGSLFVQNSTGVFVETNQKTFEVDYLCEDVNASFFDADRDGDADLYVVSGGNEFFEGAIPLRDRLYLNNGKGVFTKSDGLPALATNKSVAVAADFDHDGDMDLFVGGRCLTNRYGETPASYLLLNDDKGRFSLSPQNQALGFNSLGMVTDAAWVDYDKDGWKDLVVVGEWMPVTFFKNNRGQLANVTAQLNLATTTGWWNTVKIADINNDGWEDLLLGNLGENSKLTATTDHPLKMYVGDMNMTGFFDQILSVSKKGKYYTFLGKEEIEKRFPMLMKKKFVDYASYAGKTTEEVFGEDLKRTKELSLQTLSSLTLINNGKGGFESIPLPSPAQWAPIYAFAVGDFNNDNKTDLIAAGNFSGVSPFEGHYDASYGSVLLGNGTAAFSALSPLQSGLTLNGEVRDIKSLKTLNGALWYVVSRNNGSLLFYKNSIKQKKTSR